VTEEEWHAIRSPWALVSTGPLAAHPSLRKARLLAVACCRLIADRFPADDHRRLVQLVDDCADGRAKHREVKLLAKAVAEAGLGLLPSPGLGSREYSLYRAVVLAADRDRGKVRAALGEVFAFDGEPLAGVGARLVRDVYGNPFRPPAFDPGWRTADAVGLARGIYQDRAFDRLPLLADALMDAGCADEDILAHCRSEGPHVRGCWVVDLVLGKE
jgi:hypothetical protein